MAGAQHSTPEQGAAASLAPLFPYSLCLQYDRIDPADVQSLKDEIERLKTQMADAETAKAELEKSFQAQQHHVSMPVVIVSILVLR